MNISEVSQQLSGLLNKASSLFLAASDDFAKNLTMGQIIKGKVLRSYDAGRYLVDFNGHEKVVDSAVPLKTGELIQGRVIGIGEKVELKRIAVAAEQVSENAAADVQSRNFLGNKWDPVLRDIMLKYQIKLSTQEKNAMVSMLKNAQQPEHAVLAAVALMKQGLPMSEQLIQLLNALQEQKNSLKLFPTSQLAPVLSANHSADSRRATDEIANFALAISHLFQEQQTMASMQIGADQSAMGASTDNAGDDARHSNHDQAFLLGWQLLNTQIDGSVSHRVCTLPMWLGNKLVEINIAIYEQHGKSAAPDSIKFKRFIFSLELELLGKIEVETIIENKNIRLRLKADQASTTEWLVEHASYLKNDLVDHGWKLDEISYQTMQRDQMGSIVGSVMQHYVSQDSLNRVM